MLLPKALFVFLLTSSFSANEWFDFAVDNQLTVGLPSQPKTQETNTKEADGFEQHLQSSIVYDEFGRYDVSRDDLSHESDNYLTSKGRKEWYSVGPMAEDAVNKAVLLKRSTFKLNGIDGVDYTYELPSSAYNTRTIKYMRHLLVGKIGYVFSFTPKHGFSEPCIEQKEVFFNSIKLKP